MKDLTEQALAKITPEYWSKCFGKYKYFTDYIGRWTDMIYCFPDHMIKELKYYMQHDGLIPKPVVETPPDPEPPSNQNNQVHTHINGEIKDLKFRS